MCRAVLPGLAAPGPARHYGRGLSRPAAGPIVVGGAGYGSGMNEPQVGSVDTSPNIGQDWLLRFLAVLGLATLVLVATSMALSGGFTPVNRIVVAGLTCEVAIAVAAAWAKPQIRRRWAARAWVASLAVVAVMGAGCGVVAGSLFVAVVGWVVAAIMLVLIALYASAQRADRFGR